MRKTLQIDLYDFIDKLDTTSSDFEAFKASDIEETKGVMITVGELTTVVDFLYEHDASDEMIDAVETAMDDIERWLDPDIQRELLRQIPKCSPARVPKALLTLRERAQLLGRFP